MSRKIRILFTIPNFDTAGSGKAMLNIAMRLDKTKFEPQIACLHNKGVFFDKVKASGIPLHIMELYSPARPITKLLGGVWKVSRAIKGLKPDIVHSYNYSSDYTEAMAVKLAGSKYIFTKKNMNWGGSSANSWKLRSMLSDRIAVQNMDMIRNFYPDSKKTTLIPRGVNTSEFRPSTVSVDGLRERWNIPQGSYVILLVANLVPVKNVEVLITACQELNKDTPGAYTLVIVGDNNNDYGRKLGNMVAELGMQQTVIFTGKQQNIPDFHTIADVFVLPSKLEGSPVALLEALACGTICVASDTPGIRDQLKDFPELMFKPEDAHELAGKLKRVLAMSHDEKRSLKQKLVQMVENDYRIETEVKRHEQLYLETLGIKDKA